MIPAPTPIPQPEQVAPLIERVGDYLGRHNLGDVIGLAITVIGFTVTSVAAIRSWIAARRAARAAESTRRSIQVHNSIGDLSAALTGMDEIKRLHRTNKWEFLPDRYSDLRRRLVLIRGSSANLSTEHQTIIQSAITQLTSMEDRVEKALTGSAPPPVPRMNKILSDLIDNLQVVLVALRDQVEGHRDD